jgi:dihydrofolate reductase
MHISLIVAQTADGFIARSSTELASWTSKEDKKRFVEKTKKAQIMILGSKTFDTFQKPLPGRTHIIYSRNPEKYTQDLLLRFSWHQLPNEIQITNEHPQTLIGRLKKEGVPEIIICGGSEIYTLFMETGLVQTIYMTIEPVFFGTGISLFNKKRENSHLTLVSEEKTESGTLFLEYTSQKLNDLQ